MKAETLMTCKPADMKAHRSVTAEEEAELPDFHAAIRQLLATDDIEVRVSDRTGEVDHYWFA